MLIRPSGGAQRIFTACAAAFLLVAPFPSSAGWRVFFILVALLALGWQAFREGIPMRLSRVPNALKLGAGLWIALCVLSLAWSVDADYTLAELRREIVYGGITFLVFFAGTREAAQLQLWVRVLFVGALALALGEWIHFLFPNGMRASTFSMGPGPFSTHVAILAPLLVLFAWRAPVGLGWSNRGMLALGAATLCAGIAGDSRFLWVALTASTIVAFWTFQANAPANHPARLRVRRALFGILLLLPVFMAGSAEYKTRFYPNAASTLESIALDERPLIWRIAAGKIVERPVLGHGYGREIVRGDFRAALAAAGQPTPYFHGHNVFIDAMIQLGVVGLAAFLAFLASLAMGFAAARHKEDGLPLAITGLAILAGYLVKDLTDDFFFRPNSLVFWAIAGMLLGLAARLPKRS
ncbi:MAG TPA: O-antigen ligase family protein [Usitatibacter sp.]|nr:O-antigen ligase family protein [Usitatibacter sp.]